MNEFKMNKDVVGLVYYFLYRLKIDDVLKEYRETFKSSRINDDSIYYVPTCGPLNYRKLYNPYSYYNTTIFNFKKFEQILIKSRKY